MLKRIKAKWGLMAMGAYLGSLNIPLVAQSDVNPDTIPTKREQKVQALQEGPVKRENKQNYYGVQPEGKTLPAGLLQLRIPYVFSSGNSGFDSNKKKTSAFSARVTGTSLVMEYGITSKISAQMMLPYILSNKVTVNGDEFRSHPAYVSNYEQFRDIAANALLAKNVCSSLDACRSYIDKGGSLPTDTQLKDVGPGRETITIQADRPIKDAIDQVIIDQVASSKTGKGRTGFGDLQLGALMELTDGEGPYHISLGAGIRLPTGSYTDVPSNQRETGRGIVEGGLRGNFDLEVGSYQMVSFQHQTEYPLSKANKKTGEVRSILDGDNILIEGERKTSQRVGARHKGFVRYKLTPAFIDPSLEFLGLQAGAAYDYENAVRIDGEETSPRSSIWYGSGGLLVDLVPYKVPLRFDYEYYTPLAGESVPVATNFHIFTLKAYYLF